MNVDTAVFLGFAGALAWHFIAEDSIPREASCDWMASPVTDATAVAMGTALAFHGVARGDAFPVFAGTAMASLHAVQYFNKKR